MSKGGMIDDLPRVLKGMYSDCGYSHYRTVGFEEYDLFSAYRDFLTSGQMITFTGAGGRLLALKPDITMSIIRDASEERGRADKFFYSESVYRVPVRITEQIDAMDMMGVNSAGFLVLPKVVATTILSPLLMLLSLALGLVGGWVVVEATQIIPPPSYITGIKAFWNGFYVFYSCFKMSLFCFMISSIAAFNGYYAKGGSLGVGRSSTKAIVITSILILLGDLIVTQLMLY